MTQAVEQPSVEMEVSVKVFKGINVVLISVSDLDKAREFYRDLLGPGEPIYDLPDEDWIAI